MILEFFIAFFGIIYFATRFSHEKVRKISSEASHQTYQENKASWYSKWTNEEVEKQVKSYIADHNNYEAILREISPILNEIPGLRTYIRFGAQWHECGMYAPYWKKQGFTQKKADSQAYSMRDPILYVMLANRGCVPSPGGYVHYVGGLIRPLPAPLDIAVFKWCVKKLRLSAQMTDPVVRIGGGSTHQPDWEYTFEPLVHPGESYIEVSDDEIVMMPK